MQMIKIILLLLSFSIFIFANESAQKNTLIQDMQIFQESLNSVLRQYIYESDHTALIRSAIQGLLKELDDPYSYYLPPKERSDMFERLDPDFGGLGIQISIVDGQLTIIAPLDDTPADKAGLRAKDRIIKIEGESTKGITTEEAADKMRGPKGTQVTITIERDEDGKTTETDYTITRDIIKIKMSHYRVTDDNIGYVRIVSYTKHIDRDVAEAISALNNIGVNGLILDLRHNPGGFLDSAVKVASFFTDKSQLVVYTKGRNEKILARYNTVETKVKFLKPLIILVDKGSASASEITAGALKDWGRAVLVGETTFGKGSVQQVYQMLDNSGLRLTIAKYYTPSNTIIHNNGVKPHITVSLPSSEEIKKIIEKEQQQTDEEEDKNEYYEDDNETKVEEIDEDIDESKEEADNEKEIRKLQIREYDTQLKFAVDLMRTFFEFN